MRRVTFEEAKKYLESQGLDIQKVTKRDDSDPAWVVDIWEKDGERIAIFNEDGWKIKG